MSYVRFRIFIEENMNVAKEIDFKDQSTLIINARLSKWKLEG